MPRLVKWGYRCPKYFPAGEYLIRTVREHTRFCLDGEARAHQVCGQAPSGLGIRPFREPAPATCCGPPRMPQERTSYPWTPYAASASPPRWSCWRRREQGSLRWSPGRLPRVTPARSLPRSPVSALPPQPALPSPAEALRGTRCSAGRSFSLREAALGHAEQVGVLQLPRDQACHRQRQPQLLAHPCQREPCSWIIYTTFRWKYFVFYSVDAFSYIMRPSLKPMCVSYCQANIC